MPAAHHSHGLWYEVRLSQLAAVDFVRVRCQNCGVTQVVSPWQMHHRFHRDTLLPMIADQVRCHRCGKVGPKIWETFRAHPGLDAAPPDAEAVKRWFKEYEKR